eukprot:429940-Prymnesium_polylepis.1
MRGLIGSLIRGAPPRHVAYGLWCAVRRTRALRGSAVPLARGTSSVVTETTGAFSHLLEKALRALATHHRQARAERF